MAAKVVSDSFPESEKDDEESSPLAPWQKAWLNRHRDELIRRVPTMDVVDQLIPRRAIDPDMDVYQNIDACHEKKRNERARLLLNYIASQTRKIFWDFQEALILVGCGDLAIRREDAVALMESFSAMELSASSSSCSSAKKRRPPSVELVIEKLKKRYRKRKMTSLDGKSSRKSLDELRVNICLLSAERLDALSGTGGQRQPFATDSLKKKKASVIDLENIFDKDENGEVADMQVASGIAGSGKTTAFTQKAPDEWSKEERERAFWETISLFFEGSLTDLDWWEAQTLAEVFGLSSFGLTKEEEDEVVRYICSHADEVLLVADSMDEANVKTDSLLWRVLTGKCKAVEGLKVVICCRPCERASWLAKNCPFDRHLEVVGFTEEKIAQFIDAYFRNHAEKASELQARLVNRSEVLSLMHTPLLATMICRQFDFNKALPSSLTEVYNEAVLAMLHQSATRDGGSSPSNLLDELSPPRLHRAVVSLCKLAYEALSKKSVVIKRSALETAGSLDDAVQLGFLSASPGVNVVGHREDVYSFPHHTMLEFLAAVHAVRDLICGKKKKVVDLVSKLGVDGNLARFWAFFSGLLNGQQCEALLHALCQQVLLTKFLPEHSRRMLLLLDCYSECKSKLKGQRSTAIADFLRSRGLLLTMTYVSMNSARTVSNVIRQYSAEVCEANFQSTMLDTGCMSLIITSLQECRRLHVLHLPVVAMTLPETSGIVDIIEKNANTLTSMSVPAGDEQFATVSQAVQKCTRLQALSIGSQGLTNASAQSFVRFLSHLCSKTLRKFGLTSALDDEGFTPVAEALRFLDRQVTHLAINWGRLTSASIFKALSSLPNLNRLVLQGVPIGDDGFRQLVESAVLPPEVYLYNIGLTSISIPVLETLLRSMPARGELYVCVKRSLFSSTGQDIIDTLRMQLTYLEVKKTETIDPPAHFAGLLLTERIVCESRHGFRQLTLFF